MCYSFESSIRSWFIALISSLFLLAISKNITQSIWISAFTLTFTQIQIIEALIWKSIEDNNTNLNNIVKYIPLLLWCQPFVQCLFGYINTKNQYLLYLSLIYLFIIFVEMQTDDKYSVDISKDNHLIWRRNRNNKSIFILGDYNVYPYLYLFGLFAPLFFINNNNILTKVGLLGTAVISFMYSLQYSKDEFNSMWCYTAVSYIIVANVAEIMTSYL